MGNKHINGKDPYVMSPSAAAKEAQSWIDNGGSIRHDEANKHSPDEHYHFIDNNPNEDLLVIVDPDLEASDDNDQVTDEDSNNEDESNDDDDDDDDNDNDDD